MSRQSRIQEMAGTDLPFFPFKWDGALIGYAVRGTVEGLYYTSCYGYQALKTIIAKQTSSPEEAYKTYGKLIFSCNAPDYPLVVTRYNSRSLWKMITAKEFPRWEHLDKAIIGLGTEGWNDSGIVYNRQLCLDIMRRDQATAETNPMKITAELATRLDTEIIPTNLGDKSPWFITHVK